MNYVDQRRQVIVARLLDLGLLTSASPLTQREYYDALEQALHVQTPSVQMAGQGTSPAATPQQGLRPELS